MYSLREKEGINQCCAHLRAAPLSINLPDLRRDAETASRFETVVPRCPGFRRELAFLKLISRDNRTFVVVFRVLAVACSWTRIRQLGGKPCR